MGGVDVEMGIGVGFRRFVKGLGRLSGEFGGLGMRGVKVLGGYMGFRLG